MLVSGELTKPRCGTVVKYIGKTEELKKILIFVSILFKIHFFKNKKVPLPNNSAGTSVLVLSRTRGSRVGQRNIFSGHG